MDQKIDVVIVDVPILPIEPQNEPISWWSRAKQTIQITLLSNFHVGYLRISLALCAQALLWKTLVRSTEPFHVLRALPSTALVLLWCLALFTLITTCLIYASKCVCHFEMVKQEFLHHVGVNYFYAPWISSLLLVQASPFASSQTTTSYHASIAILVVPIIVLDIKIYGQSFTKGKRFLSRAANPASQLSVIANLVAARACVEMGWNEGALFLFALGMAHYLVLFVTLYQRLPGGNGLPANLRPIFFLFIATPSMASLAWRSIYGRFDDGAKMLFFLSLFLFVSLVCRPALFKKSMKKFSVAWWAYAFSITLLALAAYEYAEEVKLPAAHALMLLLSVISMLMLFVLLVFTVSNANKLLFGRDVDQDRRIIDTSISCT